MRVYSGLDVWSDFGGRFPWQSRLFDVGGGVRMAAVDEGPRDARLTFLLLHGNPTWSFLYREFIKALAPSHRVIAPDHVGFGRSDKPRDPAAYSLEQHIQNLSSLLQQLDASNVVPVMQDWGGPIGMGWATRNPEKVRGAVLLNTWAFVREPRLRLPLFFRFLALGRGGWKRLTRANLFTELFLARLTHLEGERLDPYRAAHPTPDDRVGVARFPQLIPQTFDQTHESWATMARIEDGLALLRDKPALIVWARKDPAFRKAQLQRWQQVFSKVDGPHLLPQASHYLQEDAPGPILRELTRWAATL